MAGRAVRSVLTILIALLMIVLVILSIRQIAEFSGRLATQNWAHAVDSVGKYLVIPFHQPSIRTPYHGFFDVNNALTILCAVLAEWGLSALRQRA